MSQTSKPPNLEFSQLGLVFPSMAYDFLVVCSEYRVAAASQDSFTRVMSSRMGWQFRLQHRAGDLMSCEVCVFISGVVQGSSCQISCAILVAGCSGIRDLLQS